MNLAALARDAYAPVERLLDAWFARERGGQATAILLALFVVAWTAFQTISFASVDLHVDMVEVYAWGLNPSWGYAKHPPLGAWMARAWFTLFPASDWAFYLLAMINAAIGLYAVDLIARRYLFADKRLLVLLFLMLTPFYQFLGVRFASNQTLLSTWPIATYCFLRAFEERNVAWSIAAGVTAALAMLGKYYSIFLIAGFVAAALIHSDRRAYLRSASPWISCAAGLVVLAPHVYWLITTGFQPFTYAMAAHGTAPSMLTVLKRLGEYFFGAFGYVALPVALFALAARPSRTTLMRALWPADPDRRILVVLLVVPLVLPMLAALVLGARLTSLWTMQAWFLLPIVLLAPRSFEVSRASARAVAALVAAMAIAALAAAPVLAWQYHREDYDDARHYYRLLGEQVTRLWRAASGQDLRFVTGDIDIAPAIAFYSSDHPSAIPNFKLSEAPWATPERLSREGYAAVCKVEDAGCTAEIGQRMAANAKSRRLEVVTTPVFYGDPGKPRRFVVGLFLPGK